MVVTIGKSAMTGLWKIDNSYAVIAGGNKTLILELKPEGVQAMERMGVTAQEATTSIKTLEEALERIEWTNIP